MSIRRRLLRLIGRQPFEDALYYNPKEWEDKHHLLYSQEYWGETTIKPRPNILNILQPATKIPVQYWEEIDEYEVTTLATGQKILARDVTEQPSMPSIPPILLWNGKKRVIKNAGGKCYLITTI